MDGARYLKMISMLAFAMNITGCALISKEFDCKYDKGVGCKSITEVNQMVDSGHFRGAVGKKSPPSVMPSQGLDPIVLTDQGMIQRVQEEHLRVWIAPYQDEQGDFHEASLIHTIIKPGAWQLLGKN